MAKKLVVAILPRQPKPCINQGTKRQCMSSASTSMKKPAIKSKQFRKRWRKKYYAAKSAQALREHLNAASEAEASLARYNYCILLNKGKAAAVYYNARFELAGCFGRETEKTRYIPIRDASRSFTAEADIACESDL